MKIKSTLNSPDVGMICHADKCDLEATDIRTTAAYCLRHAKIATMVSDIVIFFMECDDIGLINQLIGESGISTTYITIPTAMFDEVYLV